jgi:hypothetical protein
VACYLRAWGNAFDVDAFLAHSTLSWDPVWRKGERKRVRLSKQSEEHEDSGVTTLAGVGDDFPAQVQAAIAFLRVNRPEVERLLGSPGLERALLDFGVIWNDDLAARFFRFPPELVQLAAASGLELELSVYDSREAHTPPNRRPRGAARGIRGRRTTG